MNEQATIRRSTDSVLMDSASLWAQRSTCGRQHVGVVMASRHGRILSTGYNGAPSGMSHCDHSCDCGATDKYGDVVGKCMSYCSSTKPCEVSVHAEANAIAYSARYGIILDKSQLFTTHSPCVTCAMLIVNAGIFRVTYKAEHRDVSGLTLLMDAGLEVVKYEYDYS